MTREKLARLFPPGIRFKIFFTLQYFGVGIFAPYMALYFQDKGLSGAQLGTILGLMPLVSIIAQPTWSTFSDYFQSRRTMLFLSCLSAAIFAIFYTLIHSFLGLLVISILYALLYAPIGTLSTALALDYLEKENRQDEFGYIRLWGSLGFAFTAMLAGAFFIKTMMPILPLLYSAIMLVITFLVLTLPEGEKTKPTAWWEGIAVIFQRKEIIPYFIGCMFLNTSLSIGLQYVALFMNELKSPGWMIGMAISLQALLEAPLMAKVPKWTGKYGLPAVFMAGVILLPLRWLIFIVIKDPVWIIPTSIFHSLTIVSLMVVGVKYVDSKFPREWRASGQGIYSTIMNGIGPSIGLLLAGSIYEIRDLQTVWAFTLGITVLGILILLAVFKPRKHQTLLSHE
jgi:PPP family 3-phenylpropionic acid transporter